MMYCLSGSIFLYTDDTLCISMNAENFLKKNIGEYFLINPGSIRYSKIYLGNKVSKVTLVHVVEAW